MSLTLTTSFNVASGTGASHAAVSPIRHVIIISFDNTHLSDIRRMPHIAAFIGRGTLFDHDHSMLPSVTQPDMVSFLSGAYPDKTSIPQNHFLVNGHPVLDWGYWENHNFVRTPNDRRTLAMGRPYVTVESPWQKFVDHGLDVGVVGGADMALQDESEVTEYGVENASDRHSLHYLRFALHCHPGSALCGRANTLFGLPNMPWLHTARLLDGSGRVGVNQYDFLTAMESLSATYAMQAHGIPVTYSYIDTVHDNDKYNSRAMIANLKAYDHAFALFLSRLAGIGITPANTLFVVMSDEGDHYVGKGLHNYGLMGELRAHWRGFAARDVNAMSGTSALIDVRSEAEVRRAMLAFRHVSGWSYLVHGPALQAIHLYHSYSAPSGQGTTFLLVGKPDTWWNGMETDGAPLTYDLRLSRNDRIWGHGGASSDVTTTWSAYVGPNVRSRVVHRFVDHVDAVPTIDYLLGYPVPRWSDGRILYDVSSHPEATVKSLGSVLDRAATVFKQLNAPVGSFAMASLEVSTHAALATTSQRAGHIDASLQSLVAQRNTLAPQLQAVINRAAEGAPVSGHRLQQMTTRGVDLLRAVRDLARTTRS